MRRASLLALVGAVFGAVVMAGGCETIVGSGLPPYTCVGTDPDACPQGSYCSAGACVTCETPDCRASADAGLDASGMDSARPEAAVDDGSTSDGLAKDAPPDVSGDVSVDVGPAKDAAPDAADVAGDVSSDAGDVGSDAPTPDGAGCGAIGCACGAAADCQSGICGNAEALGASFTSAHGSVCTQTCCTAADCPANYVCYGPGNGGSYCVSSTSLGRPATLASAGPGAVCQADGDCRSGKCQTNTCVDLCCKDTDCTNGTSCALDAPGLDGHTVFACLTVLGLAAHAVCSVSSECASANCEFGTCRPHCCGVQACTANGFNACELDIMGPDSVYDCMYPTSAPTGSAVGQSCMKTSDCVTRLCDTTAGTCSAPCCVDTDCAPYGNYVCRPAGAAPYNLICSKS